MPDSDHLYENDTLVEPEYDEAWDGEGMQELPPRAARRGLVTPVRAGLAALLVAAAGFIGGVEAQKSQGSSGNATAAAALQAGGGGTSGRPGGFAGASGNATVGSVKSKDGRWLYVQDTSGNTVKVRTTSTSKVTRTAKASPSAIHPGDRVIIEGTKSSGGTITATQIVATSATAQAAGAGPGGAGPRGFFGGAPGGAAGGSGG